MKRTMLTVPDLLKDYEPEINDSKTRRLFKLCQFVAEKMPGSFIPRRWAAKIVNAMNKLPNDDNDACGEKFDSLITSAKALALRETGHHILKHRFLGVRITYSETDKLRYPLRAVRKRWDNVTQKLQDVADGIDAKQLSAEDRKEFAPYTKFNNLLQQFRENVPLLAEPVPEEAEKKTP